MTDFWDKHYKKFNCDEASPFGVYCLKHLLRKSDAIVELGSGNGRDAFALAPHVQSFVGFDSSAEAVHVLNSKLAGAGTNLSKKTRFINEDFTAQNFDSLIGRAERLVVYSRFSFHSINYKDAERLVANFLNIKIYMSSFFSMLMIIELLLLEK